MAISKEVVNIVPHCSSLDGCEYPCNAHGLSLVSGVNVTSSIPYCVVCEDCLYLEYRTNRSCSTPRCDLSQYDLIQSAPFDGGPCEDCRCRPKQDSSICNISINRVSETTETYTAEFGPFVDIFSLRYIFEPVVAEDRLVITAEDTGIILDTGYAGGVLNSDPNGFHTLDTKRGSINIPKDEIITVTVMPAPTTSGSVWGLAFACEGCSSNTFDDIFDPYSKRYHLCINENGASGTIVTKPYYNADPVTVPCGCGELTYFTRYSPPPAPDCSGGPSDCTTLSCGAGEVLVETYGTNCCRCCAECGETPECAANQRLALDSCGCEICVSNSEPPGGAG